jgi:hypothetical protein
MRKELTQQAASGMTVNEKLFATGLVDSFDQAVAGENRMDLQNILKQIYVHSDDADMIINQVLRPSGGTA